MWTLRKQWMEVLSWHAADPSQSSRQYQHSWCWVSRFAISAMNSNLLLYKRSINKPAKSNHPYPTIRVPQLIPTTSSKNSMGREVLHWQENLSGHLQNPPSNLVMRSWRLSVLMHSLISCSLNRSFRYRVFSHVTNVTSREQIYFVDDQVSILELTLCVTWVSIGLIEELEYNWWRYFYTRFINTLDIPYWWTYNYPCVPFNAWKTYKPFWLSESKANISSDKNKYKLSFRKLNKFSGFYWCEWWALSSN